MMKKLIILILALITMLAACEYPPDFLARMSASRELASHSKGYRSVFITGETLEELLSFWPLEDYPVEEQGELTCADLSLLESGTYFYSVTLLSNNDIDEIKDKYGPCFKDGWEKYGSGSTALSTFEGDDGYNVYCSLTPKKNGTEIYFSFDFYHLSTREVSAFLKARLPDIPGLPELGQPQQMCYTYSPSAFMSVNYNWEFDDKKTDEVFEELRVGLSDYDNFICDEDTLSCMADDIVIMAFCDEGIHISVLISTKDIKSS